MENFFNDNKDIQFHIEHMDIDRLITLKEDEFCEKETFSYAPSNVEDAKDSYRKILSIVGEICGETLAPLAPEIDEEGVKLVDGEVVYAKGTALVQEKFAQADLMGFALPRKYGGLNFPASILTIAAEMTARADASFLNFGLQQDIGETINKFGSDEQKARFLPMLASGEAGAAMILTEPDAGSDLQAVNLKAREGENGIWYLNGVKRFITNGNGEVHLVLARSEEDSEGARGLSFFLYERDEHMTIRRVENKLGIHGSPTCELQFNDAPAVLVGARRRGLTKYTMWLMNSARVGIAAQALGIAEAAYREANKYAEERIQFGVPVRSLPPVYEMLTQMKVSIEAGRTLLYETARCVDMKEALEELTEKYPEKKKEVRMEMKKYTKYASLLTPIVKAVNSEMANKVAYDGIQIHGGTGFMKEFNAERHARDARITNIYEGTTQLQVVAAIGGVTSGVASALIDEYVQIEYPYAVELVEAVNKAREDFEKALLFTKEKGDQVFTSFHARRLVDMAAYIIISFLLLKDAAHSERKLKIAETYIDTMIPEVKMRMETIISSKSAVLDNYSSIIALD